MKKVEHWSTWAVRSDALPIIRAALAQEAEAPQGAIEQVAPEAIRGGNLSVRKGTVAVLPLRGILTPRVSLLSLLFGGGGGLSGFRTMLGEAVGSDDIEAVVFDVDSPGGSTDQIAEIAAEIRAAREQKPVIAVANTFAASAAYWLASQADEIVVTPSGQVGSVGVIAMHEDWSGWNEANGIQPTYISAGRYKDEGNPDGPLDEAAQAAWQQTVDDYYELFVADVAQGRGVSTAAVKSDFGEGRMLTAKRALDAGMVDRVETLGETVARVAAGGAASARETAKAEPVATGGGRNAPNETVSEEERTSTEPNSKAPPAAAEDQEAAARTRRTALDLLFTP